MLVLQVRRRAYGNRVIKINRNYECIMVEGIMANVFFSGGQNGNGYRLSARGVRTLQTFLREHGAQCVRQFMQVPHNGSSIIRGHGAQCMRLFKRQGIIMSKREEIYTGIL
ncbi:hypothetical protein ACJJTC_005512 [Scirpophaga incertulas]